METKKKKIVAKVIAKNVLVWICTLCMVLCFIPLRSQAEEGMDEVDAVEESTDAEAIEQLADVSAEPQVDETVSCTVTLTLGEGKPYSGKTVELRAADDSVTLTETPEKSGIYIGQIKKTGTYVLYIDSAPQQEKTVTYAEGEEVKATFEYHEYTVTFYDGETPLDTPEPQTIVGGVDKTAKPADPKKEDYYFAGWMTEKDGKERFVFGNTVTENTKVYASWSEEPVESEEPDEHEHTMSGPDKLKQDESGHWQYCTDKECPVDWDNSEELPDEIKEEYFEEHDPMAYAEEKPDSCLEEDAVSGKIICAVCEYEIEESAKIRGDHTPPKKDADESLFETDATSHTYECEVCEEEVTEPHVWDDGVITKKPTAGELGEITYICVVCGYEKTEETADHEHEWDEGKITKAPTFVREGVKTFTCTVCEETKEEEIPKLDRKNVGNVTENSNTGLAPGLQTDPATLATELLTPEEKEKLANGAEIRFILQVSDETVVAEDKGKVEDYISDHTSLKGYHVAKYIDVSLCKEIDGESIPITDTNGPLVCFTIQLPKALVDANRSYGVIRVHDGVAEPMIVTEQRGILYVNTDKFSTYAIIYNGEAVDLGDGTDDGNNGSGNNAGNGSNTGNNGNGNNTGNGSNTGNGNNTGNTGNGGNNGASGSTSDANNGNTGNQGNATTATDSNSSNANNNNTGNASPKTADSSPIVLYMTIAMISAMAYLFLFVTDKDRRMTEQDKEVLIRELTLWARKHGATAKFFMAFAVFCILLYYHTVGKRVKGVAREQA